jgi:hypothetical protein
LPQHHFSHAAYALYTSPFEQPFIVSYDGGGQEGAFNIYRGARLPRLHRDWAHPSALPVAFCVGAHMRCLILCANVRVCESRCVHSSVRAGDRRSGSLRMVNDDGSEHS